MRPSTLARSLALAFFLVPLVPDAPTGGVRCAEAAVSVHMTVDELVRASRYVAVATALEQSSVWEDADGGRRIVTYTRLHIEQPVVGDPGAELWVRTLGGAVGRIGQQVSGEAHIALGSTSLLFLADGDGALAVAGLAQGHFPVVRDDKGATTLAPSPDAGLLLPRRGPSISAREVLAGATLDRAVDLVTRARRARDAK